MIVEADYVDRQRNGGVFVIGTGNIELDKLFFANESVGETQFGVPGFVTFGSNFALPLVDLVVSAAAGSDGKLLIAEENFQNIAFLPE